jgi:hypothetical protein
MVLTPGHPVQAELLEISGQGIHEACACIHLAAIVLLDSASLSGCFGINGTVGEQSRNSLNLDRALA